MPELPEVETVRRGLAPVMEGGRIARAELRRAGLRWPFPERLAERLAGREVLALRRRSKYILADLAPAEGAAPPETLIIHLGMSGRMLVEGALQGRFAHGAGALGRHDHVVLHMASGARIVFNDARRFGMLDLWPTDALESHRLLARLGPEPLGNAFSEAYLRAALRGRRSPIKAALLDQRIVAGLGNIYVCEILHRTGISPRRAAGSISARRLGALVGATREVLREAIAAGGASLRDHRQTTGEMGYFQHDFRVYGREGEACPRPGCAGRIRRFVQSGRSTFHCPRCQR